MEIHYYPNFKLPDDSIIVYGGSFSPMHDFHVKIIRDICDINSKCHFYIVPVNDKYPKDRLICGKNDDNINHRIYMCQQVVDLIKKDQNDLHIEVSDIAFTFDEPFVDNKVIRYFQKLYHRNNIYFVMGDDVYNKINTWQPEDLKVLQTVHLIIYPRDNPISSSDIKKNYIETGRILNVPAVIQDYIHAHDLFKFSSTL